MDISTKNINRLADHVEQLRYQWTDKYAELEAHVAARARYREVMNEIGYPQPDEDKPAVVEYAENVVRRARLLWMGLMRVES